MAQIKEKHLQFPLFQKCASILWLWALWDTLFFPKDLQDTQELQLCKILFLNDRLDVFSVKHLATSTLVWTTFLFGC